MPAPTRLSPTQDLLTILQQVAPALGHPRIKALHLPPPGLGDALHSKRGEFAALELECGAIGLTYVLLGDTLQTLHGHHTAAQVQGRRALDVAMELLANDDAGVQAGDRATQQALAWSAAHALGHALMRRAAWQPPAATDSLAALAPGPGDHIGLVGLFGPLMDRLVASGARITVLELRADWVGQHPGYEVTLKPQALRACNKVLATGTLLLNNTLDTVLAHTAPQARVALVGPTVSGLPDMLFARGVQVVGGTWVQDPAAFLQALGLGQPRGQAARKFVLTPAQWPGWRAFLG